MNKLLFYLLESGVCLLVFYLLYAWLLKRETGFQYNRFYLLVTPLLSFLLPLVELPFLQQPEPLLIFVSEQLAPITITTNQTVVAAQNTWFTWKWILLATYALGLVFFIYRLGRQLYHLYRFNRQTLASHFWWRGIRVHQTNGRQPTFSFDNCIYWDNSQPLSTAETERIFLHEAVHVHQKHTRDILYLELLKCVFWFNPLLYLYQIALAATHEFIADAAVLRTTNQEAYTNLLAKQVLHRLAFSFGNYFNKSLTLKRIKMIQQTYRRPSLVKQLMALPVLGMIVFLLACAETESPVINSEKQSSASGDLVAPQFPGGRKALYEYLIKNIKYPSVEVSKENSDFFIATNVVIGKDGKVIKHESNATDAFHREVSRVINNMPAWQPATRAGKPTESGYRLLFNFTQTAYEGDIEREDLIDVRSPEQLGIPDSNRPIFSAGDIIRLNEKEITIGQLDNTTTDEEQVQYEEIFTQVEQQPQFPGGLEKMYSFLGTNIKYPKAAVQANLEGMVVAKFQVTKEGKIKDIKIIKGLSPETAAEAKRVISLMPDWEPGKQNNNPVNVEYTLPIKFALSN